MIIAKPCRFTSVIGNTTIAELESTPKDSDLVGGASPYVYIRDRRESTTRVRLVRRDERDCESLPSRSRPIHNRSLQNTACKTSSRTAVAKQTGSFLAVSYPSDRTAHAQFIGLNTGS